MFKQFWFYVGILTLIAMLSLSTASTYAVGEKETLIIGMQDDIASLDPARAYTASSWGILSQIYEKLVSFKEGDLTQPIPELAESWEFKDDGKTWTFRIRKGISFSSGKQVNADAVTFSLHRAIKLGSESSWVLTQFGLTEESITKIDEYTVQIVLDQQYAPSLFLSCLTTSVGSILDPEVVMANEKDSDMGSAWLEENSAGTGPFILEQRKQDAPAKYVLKANEQYWRSSPVFKQIVVKGIQEPLEQMVMLEKGEIDIAWNLQPDQAKRLTGNPEIRISESLTSRITYVSMNLGYAPLSKSEVRDAIRYAIDYDGIINYILQGAAVKIQTFIPQGLFGYNPAMPYRRDVHKAKQLLTEAGYPDGFDVELACLNFSPWFDVALKIKNDLAEVGINVKLTSINADRLMESSSSREFQMYMWYWVPDFADPDNNAKIFAHSDSLGDDATVKMLAWECKYVNLETSELVELATQELDRGKREVIYKKATDIILDDGPFLLLYTPIHQYGVRSEVWFLLGKPSLLWFDFPPLQ